VKTNINTFGVVLAIIISLFMAGCSSNQPQKIRTSEYPQIEIKTENIQELKDKLINEMSKLDFSLSSSSDSMLDFRKQLKPGEAVFFGTLLGTEVNFRGIDFTFDTVNGITTIKGKPCLLFKTYSGKTAKRDMHENASYYNEAQTILNSSKP